MDQIIKPILLRYKTIHTILGPSNRLSAGPMDVQTIEHYLNRLKFSFVFDEIKQVWKVRIPGCRTEDITREIDLIEEIGRLHGFNNFLVSLPKFKTIGTEDINYKTRKKVTSCLLALGFNELINYSLVSEKTFIDNEIHLMNPLVSEYSSLRTSLLPSLVKAISKNVKQSNSIINGFEYGHIFVNDSKLQFNEKNSIAGIFGGLKTKLTWSNSEILLNWFEAKGKIEQFFNQLNFPITWKKALSSHVHNLFHISRVSDIYLDTNTKLGIFGQLHPMLANKLHFPAEIYLFEFNLGVIQHHF